MAREVFALATMALALLLAAARPAITAVTVDDEPAIADGIEDDAPPHHHVAAVEGF